MALRKFVQWHQISAKFRNCDTVFTLAILAKSELFDEFILLQRLLNSSYTEAVKLLTENRGLLDEIAEFLLVKETITGDELMSFVNAVNEKTVEIAEEAAAEPAETVETGEQTEE